MIRITNKQDCCGCHACASVCARHSITMHEDNEGFLYPVVDASTCTDCGLCEKVCPVINQDEPRKPLKVYAAKHEDDEIRMKSSSGGIFTLLAEQIIDVGGVVFGARFDEFWEVIHDYTETKEGLAAFRGSKYVQSKIGKTYQQAEFFLKAGRKVMYTGTPCQIAGLKKYLRKEYANLLAVDFVCHGVPSPKVWRMYLDESIACQNIESNIKSPCAMLRKKFIKKIEFRSKSSGWKNFSFALSLIQSDGRIVTFTTMYQSELYMQSFLYNLTLRQSCFSCSFKKGKNVADITMGDFWNIDSIDSSFYDDAGVSLLLVYSEKALKYLKYNVQLRSGISYGSVLQGNHALDNSVIAHPNRNALFKNIDKKNIINILKNKIQYSFWFRLKRKIKKIIC